MALTDRPFLGYLDRGGAGYLSTAHVFLKEDLPEKDIWKVYRQAYSQEPFMRIVKTKDGIYRYPEPKILTGSNYCDVGFEKDARTNRLVVLSAIDNFVKGTSGNAVQALNVMTVGKKRYRWNLWAFTRFNPEIVKS